MSTPAPTPALLDVFISYAREDRPTASQLAAALQARGLSVWWDREILGGAEFSEVIERELTRARVALVLWSTESVRSSFVRDESARAFSAGKLLPVRIEDVAPPLGFGQIHTLDLLDWDGEDDAPALAELVAHIQRHLKGDAVPLPGDRGRRRLTTRRRTLVAGSAAAAAAVVGWLGWRQWFARNTELARTLTGDGIEKFEARMFTPARFLFNQALEADDRYAPAYFYRAQVLIQAGAPQGAAADLRHVLELRTGLDEDLLSHAKRWLSEVSAGESDPAPVTRVAAAETAPPEVPPAAAPSPAAEPAPTPAAPVTAAPPAPMTEPKATLPEVAAGPPIVAKRPSGKPPTLEKRPSVIAQAPAPVSAPPPVAGAMLSKLEVVGPRSLPLDGAAQDKLKAAVERMFSPSKDTRLAATTGLIVDAEAGSDAAPLAITRALQAQRAGPPRDEAGRAGVINVLTLLQSASPSTLALNADDIRRLLESAKANGPQTAELVTSVSAALVRAEKLRPLVYLQIASDAQRALAAALAARLRAGGYRVPEVEVVGAKAPTRTEVRVQGRSDQGLARWMAKAAEELTGAPVEVKTLRSAKPNVDAFEIWLDAKLCTAADRRPAACAE